MTDNSHESSWWVSAQDWTPEKDRVEEEAAEEVAVFLTT